MSKRISVPVILTFLPLLFVACVEEIDLNKLNGPVSNRLVIEGSITNEMKPHAVILSRTDVAIPDAEVKKDKVSGASVEISDGVNSYILNESDTLPGVYFTAPDVKGEVGKTYTLTVEIGQTTYTASDSMEPVTPFEPTDELFALPNRVEEFDNIPGVTDVYEHRFPHVRYGTAAPSKQVLFAYDSVISGLRQATFYEFPRIDPQGFLLSFQGDNPRLIIEEGSTIVQFKSSMSIAHYLFVRAVYAETRFRGGIFDVVPGNAPTNVSHDGLGFFSASEVISRTFTVAQADLDQ
ncbi:DUF4249 domain-containing protein [Fulvivirga sp. M361]|uniref:DUF4249 family protein n=1 Tax=Fulvivirga sp. M361 TaxID=2594266 RepID=UPI00117A6759|nr:DUF4249 family protein [Fulvivirga sp. M361]TRX60030.1 DUF4249 domain-containing protein [Fulvivirga sp. M361]